MMALPGPLTIVTSQHNVGRVPVGLDGFWGVLVGISWKNDLTRDVGKQVIRLGGKVGKLGGHTWKDGWESNQGLGRNWAVSGCQSWYGYKNG